MMEPGEPDKQGAPLPRPATKRVRKTWGIRFFLVSAALFAIVALLGAQYVWRLEYTGTASFRRSDDPAIDTQTGSFDSIKLTLVDDLKAPQAVMRAVKRLGRDQEFGFEEYKSQVRAEKGPPPEKPLMFAKDQAAEERLRSLVESIKVVWRHKSRGRDMVYVTFTHHDPQLAQEMPDALAYEYIHDAQNEIIRRLWRSQAFLEESAAEANRRLARAIKDRVNFELQHAGNLPNDPGVFDQEMRAINADIDTVRRQLEVAVQERDRLKKIAEAAKANPDAPSQVIRGPNPKLYELKKDLSKYERILDDQFVLEGMTERSPIVQRLRKRIAEIKKEIEETPPEVVLQRIFGKDSSAGAELAVALAAVQSQVDLATRELDRLQKRHRESQTLLADYAPTRQQYLDIIRKCDELEGEKANWQIRLTEIQMALSAEVAKRRTRLEIVQVAEKHLLPESPKLSHVLGFALIGGLVYGGLLVFVHNVVDRSIARTLVWLAKCFDRSVVPAAPAAAFFGAQPDAAPADAETRWRWLGILRSVLRAALGLVLIALLAVAILNVTLWLRYPDQYEQWRADPAAYVSEGVHAGIVERLRERWEAP